MAKKKVTKNVQITEDLAVEVVENVVAAKKGSKQDKFFLYWLFGLTQKNCAKLVGYSETHASRLVKKFREDAKTRQRVEQIADLMPDTYRTVCKLRLPWISEIEGKGLGEYDRDPRLAVTNPQLLKQVKTGAGVKTDIEISPTIIPITVAIQMQNHLAAQQRQIEGEIVDVEPEENKQD